MTNRARTLYVGITNDLQRRVFEHSSHVIPGFTSRYAINRLLYAEEFNDVRAAIDREKQIKRWRRSKKIALINSLNPKWRNLALDWSGIESLRVDPSTPQPSLGMTERERLQNDGAPSPLVRFQSQPLRQAEHREIKVIEQSSEAMLSSRAVRPREP